MLLKGKGIGRYMVVKTVEALKRQQIGNICLFADSEGGSCNSSRHAYVISLCILACSKVNLLQNSTGGCSPEDDFFLQLWASTNNWDSSAILTVSGNSPTNLL